MDILDFFDIKDTTHLKAWQYLEKNGMWPKKFIPDDVTFEGRGWQNILAFKMAIVKIFICLRREKKQKEN